MITLSTQLVNSMSPAFVCLIYLLLLIPLTIPFCWSACLSGLEFMALYLLGLDLIFLTGHSVWNVLVNFHSLTTVATGDLSSFHCMLLRWAHSFLHSDLIIIYMLMTPSCSYPSRQPSSVITLPVCRLVLAPSQTGWPQICSVSRAQRLNSCSWLSSLNWINTKSCTDQISSVSRACFYHIRDLQRIRPVLDFTTSQSFGTSFVHSRFDYCNSLYYGLSKIQLNRLQHIQNSLARAAPRSCQPFWNLALVPRKRIASQPHEDWSSPVRYQSSAREYANSVWPEHHRGSCAVPRHSEVAWCHTGLQSDDGPVRRWSSAQLQLPHACTASHPSSTDTRRCQDDRP